MAVRLILLASVALLFDMSVARAQVERPQRLRQDVPKPVAARPVAPDPCAQFGPGFVRVDGGSTCVKVGGAISTGVGVTR